MPRGLQHTCARNWERGRAPLRRTLIFWMMALLLGTAAPPAVSQITWLNWEDGDVLNVSSASGLMPGRVELDVSRSLESGIARGEILHHHFLFKYGLTRSLTFGASGRHLQQKNGELFKDGLGDSNLFLKWHWRPKSSAYAVGLRPSISIPTGYELERPGLESFTSSHNDFALQALFSFHTDKLGIHLNPGVIATGGDNPMYLTAGAALNLHRFIPLGIDMAGEYFTRWNMVTEDFESDVFMKFHRSLFWGLSLETGVKRRLLESASSQAEWRFGLSFGRVHDPHADKRYLPPPKYPPVHLNITSVSTGIPDPLGWAPLLTDEFRTTGKQQAHGVPVYVGTDGVSKRGYTMNIEIIQAEDGRVGGISLPMILRAPRAEAEVHARVRLLDEDGVPVGRDEVFQASASRGLGAQLAPMNSDIENEVVPDEVRNDLRRKAARKLAEVILDSNTDVIGRRESK